MEVYKIKKNYDIIDLTRNDLAVIKGLMQDMIAAYNQPNDEAEKMISAMGADPDLVRDVLKQRIATARNLKEKIDNVLNLE